jgi:hypothetical protein
MAILDEFLDGPEGSGQSVREERPGAVQLALPYGQSWLPEP